MKNIIWILLMFLAINCNAVQSRKDARAVHKPNDSIEVLNVSTLTAINIYTEQITVSSIVVILSTTSALKTDSVESNTSGNVQFKSPAFIPNVQVGTSSVRTDYDNYSNVNSTTMVQVETNKQTINGYIVANSTNAEQVEILRSSVNTNNHFVSVTSSQSATINDGVNYIAVNSSNTGQIISNTNWITVNSTNGTQIEFLTSSVAVNNNYIIVNSSNEARWDTLSNYQVVTATNSIELNFQKSTTTALNNFVLLTSSNSAQINSNTNFVNVTSSNTQQIIDDTKWISVNSSNSVELNFQKSTTTVLNNYVLVTSSNSAQIINNTNWIVLNSSNIAKWATIGIGTSSAAWYCDGTTQWNSNSGNVGIGVTNPTAKLDVNGLIVSTAINVNGKVQESGNNLMPAGSMIMYASTNAPAGWLLCDGSVISRTTYANLWNAIGGSYGWGDNSTTFNLPNMKGNVPGGYNSADANFNRVGKSGGTETETLTTAQIPAHAHYIDYQVTSFGGAITTIRGEVNASGNNSAKQTRSDGGSGGSHNNLQPYVVVNYIIKY